MEADLSTDRIFVIDIARFYAMALVFYGHFIEELMLLKNPERRKEMGEYGRKRAEHHFCSARMAQDFIDLTISI